MAAHDPRQSMELTGAASQSINRILGHIEWQRLPIRCGPWKTHNQWSAGTARGKHLTTELARACQPSNPRKCPRIEWQRLPVKYGSEAFKSRSRQGLPAEQS